MCTSRATSAAKSLDGLLEGLGDGVHGTLSEKLAERIRRAIAVGVCRPGDVLPTIREFASRLGTSIKVPEAALRRLADEGLVRSRPRLGSVVLGSEQFHWRGQVLIVAPSGNYVYLNAMIVGALRARLSAAGYLVTVVSSLRSVPGVSPDRRSLQYALRDPVSLVVSMFEHELVLDTLVESGVPYVTVGGRTVRAKGCIGCIPSSLRPSVSAFVDQCASRRVRRVAVACQQRARVGDVSRQIAAAGLEAVPIVTDVAKDFARPEGVERGALATFARLFATRGPKSDVYLILDDFVCSGAVTAMLEAGLSSPRDVKIVTLSNKGYGPVYSKPFTRLEVDHERFSRVISEAVLEYLSGRVFPKGLQLSPDYVEGETF